MLDNIFIDFEIDVNKIGNIVTDGGSEFCKMFKESGSTTDAIIQDTPEDEYDDDSPTTSRAQKIVSVWRAPKCGY